MNTLNRMRRLFDGPHKNINILLLFFYVYSHVNLRSIGKLSKLCEIHYCMFTVLVNKKCHKKNPCYWHKLWRFNNMALLFGIVQMVNVSIGSEHSQKMMKYVIE